MVAPEDGTNGDLDEHRFPATPSTVVPDAEDIRQLNDLRDRGVEMEESESNSDRKDRPATKGDAESGAMDIAGFKVLQSLLTSSLFADYLHYRAIRAHNYDKLETRVHRFCMDHKVLSATCTVLDMVTRLLVWIAVFGTLVAVIGATVYKTFIAEIIAGG